MIRLLKSHYKTSFFISVISEFQPTHAIIYIYMTCEGYALKIR